MTLDELLKEGERLKADVQSAIDLRMPSLADVAIGLMHDFYSEHGSRLLAVCRAAVEWDASEAEVQAAAKDPGRERFYRATGIRWQCKNALRAAVRGDAGGKGMRQGYTPHGQQILDLTRQVGELRLALETANAEVARHVRERALLMDWAIDKDGTGCDGCHGSTAGDQDLMLLCQPCGEKWRALKAAPPADAATEEEL